MVWRQITAKRRIYLEMQHFSGPMSGQWTPLQFLSVNKSASRRLGIKWPEDTQKSFQENANVQEKPCFEFSFAYKIWTEKNTASLITCFSWVYFNTYYIYFFRPFFIKKIINKYNIFINSLKILFIMKIEKLCNKVY